MNKIRKFTKREIQKVVSEYRKGASMAKIRRTWGCSRSSVYNWIKEKGVEPHYERLVPEDTVRQCVEAYKLGMESRDIAKKFKITRSNLYKWLRKEGVEIRSGVYSYQQKAAAIKAFISGMSVETILVAHDINKKTLIKWRQEFGVAPRKMVWNGLNRKRN